MTPDHGVVHEGVAATEVLENGAGVREETGVAGSGGDGEKRPDGGWVSFGAVELEDVGMELLELAQGRAFPREGSEGGGLAGRDGLLSHWQWSSLVHLLGVTPTQRDYICFSFVSS